MKKPASGYRGPLAGSDADFVPERTDLPVNQDKGAGSNSENIQ